MLGCLISLGFTSQVLAQSMDVDWAQKWTALLTKPSTLWQATDLLREMCGVKTEEVLVQTQHAPDAGPGNELGRFIAAASAKLGAEGQGQESADEQQEEEAGR